MAISRRTDEREAARLAAEMCAAVEEARIVPAGWSERLTIAAGAVAIAGGSGETFESALARADETMYAAKARPGAPRDRPSAP